MKRTDLRVGMRVMVDGRGRSIGVVKDVGPGWQMNWGREEPTQDGVEGWAENRRRSPTVLIAFGGIDQVIRIGKVRRPATESDEISEREVLAYESRKLQWCSELARFLEVAERIAVAEDSAWGVAHPSERRITLKGPAADALLAMARKAVR